MGLWTGYEAVFNSSFGHLPVWVLCSYNANGTPDPIIEGVWQTHPEVVAGDAWTSERATTKTRIGCCGGSRPPRLGPPDCDRSRSVASVEEFRERLARELPAERMTPRAALDMLLAVSEVARNAITHGGGIRDVRIGRAGAGSCARSSTAATASTILRQAISPRGTGSARVSGSPASSRGRSTSTRPPPGFTARIWL